MELGNQTISNIISTYEAAQIRWTKFRRNQERNYRYVIGEMITDKARKALEENGRPIYEFQLPSRAVEYVAGKLQREMRKIKAVPVSPGDEQTAELNTRVTEWAIGDKGYQGIAQAALDAEIGKIGWVHGYWCYRNDPEGEFICESVDPFLVLGDPEGRQNDQSDWKYLFYIPWMSAEEIINIYRKYLNEDQITIIRRNAEGYEGTYHDQTKPKAWYQRVWNSFVPTASSENRLREMGLLTDFVNAQSGLYRVIEFHDRRTVTKKVIYSPLNGEFEVLEDERAKDAEYIQSLKTSERFPMAMEEEISAEVIYITPVCPALLPDNVLFELPYPTKMQGRGFALKQIVYRKIHPDPTEVQSLMDRLIAPADMYNQRMMSAVDLVLKAQNPPMKAEKGSIDNSDLEDWRSKASGVLKFFKKGYTAPEEQKPPTEVFQMLQVLAKEGQNQVDNISGIGLNAAGYQESSSESGVLAQTRIQQTELMLSDFFKNVTATTIEMFNYANATIKQFLSEERTIRLLNDEGDFEWVTVNQKTIHGLMNDVTQGKYDFKTDVSVSGEYARKENIAMLTQGAPLVQSDPVVSLALAAFYYKNLGTPDGKKLAALIEQRVGLAVGQEQQSQALQQAAAKLSLADQAKQMLLPQKAGVGKEA